MMKFDPQQTIKQNADRMLEEWKLVTILRDEEEQQRMLERQFANRRASRPSIESYTFREDED